MREAFGAVTELIAGGDGVFDVTVDDNKVFSKAKTGRFPEDGEVVKLIRRG